MHDAAKTWPMSRSYTLYNNFDGTYLTSETSELVHIGGVLAPKKTDDPALATLSGEYRISGKS